MVELQSKVKRYSAENSDIAAQLQIYKETQDELTVELADFKEKYREVLDLLHDTQDEIKDLKKRQKSHYLGLGQHNVNRMFERSNGGGGSDFEELDNDKDGTTTTTYSLSRLTPVEQLPLATFQPCENL